LLEEFRESWSDVGDAAPLVAPPAELFEQIKQRRDTVAASNDIIKLPQMSEEIQPSPLSTPQRVAGLPRWARIAACLAAVGTGLLTGSIWSQAQRAADLAEIRSANSERLHAVQHHFHSTDLWLAALNPASAQAKVRGHVVIDAIAKQMHAVVSGLAQLPDGSSYRLWCSRSDGTFVALGKLASATDRVWTLLVDLPELPFEAIQLTITIESDAELAPDRPQGDSLLEGKFTT
jgi:hypothetical protein